MDLLNYVHELLGGHKVICSEILEEFMKDYNMFVKYLIMKSELVDACGRESHMEQPLHWTLVH